MCLQLKLLFSIKIKLKRYTLTLYKVIYLIQERKEL